MNGNFQRARANPHIKNSHMQIHHVNTRMRDQPCSTKVGIPKTITEPKTTTMYQIHTYGSNKCMHVVHSGGFRSGDGFRYSYLIFVNLRPSLVSNSYMDHNNMV